MEYTTLGDTGLEVSRLCLGCMSFGQDDSEWRDWMLGEAESREIIERAIDLGITFFDTANRYAMGDSERMLGEVLSEYDRNQSVVATKVHPKGNPEGYPRTDARGLSRKAIDHTVEGSLDRLGVDVIDLYQIHRWDPETPIEETLRVLDDVVDRGPTSLPTRYTRATCSDSSASSRYRTTTIWRTAKRNERCSCSVKTKGSA